MTVSNLFCQGRCRLASLLRSRLILLPLWGASFVTAHPLGNFSVNRYSRLQMLPDGVQIFYVLDMAEIPTFQEMGRLDLDGDDAVDQAEKETYGAAKTANLLRISFSRLMANPWLWCPNTGQ